MRRWLALGALVVASTGACIWWNQWATKRTIFCSAIVTQWGQPTCFNPLAVEVAKHRSASYRLSIERGRVLLIERVNGSGSLVDNEYGEAIWEFDRSNDSRVTIRVLNQFSREYQGHRILTANGAREVRRDRDDRLIPSSYGIERVLDSNGWTVEERYSDVFGVPRAGKFGAFGYRNEYDDQGLIQRMAAIGATGTITRTTLGIATVIFKRNEFGDPVEENYLDETGKPVSSHDGPSTVVYERDQWGNAVAVRFLDATGQPTLHRDWIAGWTATFDDCGNEVERHFFGLNGEPVVHVKGFAGRKDLFDERGRITESSFFSVDGGAIAGVARITFTRDDKGRVIQEEYWEGEGKRTLNDGLVASATFQFDENGNRTREECYGLDGKLTLSQNGYAVLVSEYDDLWNEVRRSFLGVDRQPIIHSEGCAAWRKRYNENRDISEIACLDTAGGYRKLPSGHAIERIEYDSKFREVARTYWDENQHPALTNEGFFESRSTYDADGRLLRKDFLGPDGKPAVRKDGYSTIEYQINGSTRFWSMLRYLGPTGTPVTNRARGFSIQEVQRDSSGNVLVGAFFDPEHRPVRTAEGYAAWRSRYEGAEPAESSYIDVDGITLATFRWASVHGRRSGVGVDVARDRPLPAALAKSVALFKARLALEELRQSRADLFDGARGVMVNSVVRGSTAEREGLVAGDFLLSYDGRALASVADLRRAIRLLTRPKAMLSFLRGSEKRVVEVAPGPLGVLLDSAS